MTETQPKVTETQRGGGGLGKPGWLSPGLLQAGAETAGPSLWLLPQFSLCLPWFLIISKDIATWQTHPPCRAAQVRKALFLSTD